MPQTGDKPRHVLYSDGSRRRVALRLQGKVHKDTTRTYTDTQLAYSVATSVTRRSSYVQARDVWNHEPRKRSGTMLKGMRTALEMLANSAD